MCLHRFKIAELFSNSTYATLESLATETKHRSDSDEVLTTTLVLYSKVLILLMAISTRANVSLLSSRIYDTLAFLAIETKNRTEANAVLDTIINTTVINMTRETDAIIQADSIYESINFTKQRLNQDIRNASNNALSALQSINGLASTSSQ